MKVVERVVAKLRLGKGRIRGIDMPRSADPMLRIDSDILDIPQFLGDFYILKMKFHLQKSKKT